MSRTAFFCRLFVLLLALASPTLVDGRPADAPVAASSPAVPAAPPLDATFRLTRDVIPSLYTLELTPDLEARRFKAHATVTVRLARPLDRIRLHALELDLTKVQARIKKKSYPAKVIAEPDSQTAALDFPRALPAGEVVLEFDYTGRIHDRLRGLQLEVRDGERAAVTIFEPSDARRVLPCFDEPTFKARFDLTLILPKELTAVSNGRLREERLDPKTGLKTVRFDRSPLQSSYLFAFAFGDFVKRSATAANGIPVTLYTLKSKAGLTDPLMDATLELLPLIEQQFGIPYPYEKLDLVIVPQYPGAMEHTAAIFSLDSILIDAKAPLPQRQRMAGLMAHEIAHQWFGDLVTTAWWDDLWLNEAFADWMSTRTLNLWKPEWQTGLEESIGKREYVLFQDSLATTHAIRAPVKTVEEANDSFDAITYGKGSMVLSMLEAWLGSDAFWAGVRHYLQTFREGNATAHDLFAALEKTSGKPLDALATSWFDQPGFPLVTMASRCENGKQVIDLSQQRFYTPARSIPDPAGPTWHIPLPLKYDLGQGAKLEWRVMSKASERIELPGCGWVYPNADQASLFRLMLRPDARKALDPVLASGLSLAERAGLLSDAWALAVSGMSPIGDYLELVEQFRQERSRFILETLASRLGSLRMILPESARPALVRYVEGLFGPLAAELGWDPKPGEDDEKRELRAVVLEVLGSVARSEPVLKEARRRVDAMLADPKGSSLDPSLVSTAVGLAALRGDMALFDAYLEAWRKTANPAEKRRYFGALSDFEAPAIADRARALALSDEVPIFLRGWLMAGLMFNEASRERTWTYVKGNWEVVSSRLTPEGQAALIHGAASFCDAARRDEVKAFFTDPAHRIEESARELSQGLERMELCIELKERLSQPLTTWLEARNRRK